VKSALRTDMNPRKTTFKYKALSGLAAFIALFIPTSIAGKEPISPSPTGHALAFARYIASIQERNPFTESGPVMVEIGASLPALYKQARLLAVRRTGDSEKVEYAILQMAGDAIVMQEVVARYLEIAEPIQDLPFTSTAITPANYKFRYLGEIGKAGAAAHRFQIIPRKKRQGLIQGELWIDAATGSEVLQTGRLIIPHSRSGERVHIVRDTSIIDGRPLFRVSHVSMDASGVGRGELTITELPANPVQLESPSFKTLPGFVPSSY
jgi:hypothetical protein